MYYTEEQVKIAKNTDLIRLIESYGYQVRKERNAYRVLGIDGGLYIFDKNQNDTQGFYWHEKSLKGNAIDFCKAVFNDDYKNAIERLLKNNTGVQPLDSNYNQNKNQSVQPLDSNYNQNKNQSVQPLDSEKDFKLPDRDNTIKQAYSYLINTRFISKSLVDKCIKYGLIRQFRERNHVYVGFIGKNKNDEPKYLMLRSTLTNSSFKKEYENSNKKYGFKVFNLESVQPLDSNNEINIYVFESPIDLLSYMTLNPTKSLKNNAFLSMGGVSTLTLKQFIADYKPKIGSINVCFDADEPGQDNANKIKAEYGEKYKVNILKPIYKDYNKQLIAIKQEINQSVQPLDTIKEEQSRAIKIN